MKKGILLSISLLLAVFMQAQNDKSLCRVQEKEGKEIYVQCDPVRDYEIVGKVEKYFLFDIKFSKKVSQLVSKVVGEEKKGEIKPFDAILISEGEIATLIKFTDNNIDKKGIGRVYKKEGRGVFILCEPVLNYKTVGRVKSRVSETVQAYNQTVYIAPSITTLIESIIDRAVDKELENKIDNFDAIITEDGNVGILIKFD